MEKKESLFKRHPIVKHLTIIFVIKVSFVFFLFFAFFSPKHRETPDIQGKIYNIKLDD